MKPLKLITIIMLIGCVLTTTAQRSKKEKKLKSTETIQKEYQFTGSSPDNILVVNNVYGSIDVKGYNGNTIKVEVIKTIEADTQEDLELGKKVIGIKYAKKEDAVYVYLDSPYSSFNLETGNFDYRENYYNYRRNYKHRKKRMYRFRLDFKIKVPNKSSIDIKTINKGSITVNDLQAKLLIVDNINGSIDLKNVTGKTDVSALNKDINITYTKNPTEESWYRSLNGDINIKFKDGLGASISYKTMNGSFFTNFDVEETKPLITRTEEKRKKGTKYKVDSHKHFKIGDGKVHLHFNQLNGDIILKK